MALVICRRLPGSFCGTPPRPALIKHHINKKLPGQTCEDCVLTAKTISTDTRMAATLKLLKPLGYRAFCNPFACSTSQSVAYWNVGSYTWHRGQDTSEHSSLCHPAEKVENVCSTSCSGRILTTNSALPGLEFSRAFASKASMLMLGSPRAMKVDEEDIEVFDSFEDPRVFLQLRPEYQLHSYNRSEPCHPLSVSEEVQLDVNMKPLPFNREATSTEDAAKLRLKHVGVSLTDDLMNQLLKGKSGGHFQGEIKSETGQQPMELEKTAIPLEGSLYNVANRSGAMEMVGLCPPDCVQTPQVKLAIQLTNKNQYCYGSRDLLGLHNMKRRQLSRLGYRVVELSHWEWLPLLKRTRLEKLAFLHEKVFTSAL